MLNLCFSITEMNRQERMLNHYIYLINTEVSLFLDQLLQVIIRGHILFSTVQSLEAKEIIAFSIDIDFKLKQKLSWWRDKWKAVKSLRYYSLLLSIFCKVNWLQETWLLTTILYSTLVTFEVLYYGYYVCSVTELPMQ